MESRDRDAAVDRWLRRASVAAADVAPTEACLDPESMAAWIDGRLKGAALAGAETHVASCARCQAIAATISRTESIAKGREFAVENSRDPSSREALAGAKSLEFSTANSRPWRWLTWAVPLTAAATIVTVVLVEWRPKPQQVQTEARADAPSIADARQAQPASPPPPAATPAAKPDLKDEAGRGAPAQEKRLDARDSSKKERARAPADKATTPSSTLAQSRSEATAASRRAAEQKQSQKPAAPARAEELDRLGTLARANEGMLLEIRSPDPAVRWRVTGARVQRSGDAGSTWTDVPTGGVSVITAGAAPTTSVCWLAGRGGMVQLTTDGGATWQRVPLPDATDLSAIRATDARAATVTTTDGREFSTTDGGRTWVRRDLQEIRTAPF